MTNRPPTARPQPRETGAALLIVTLFMTGLLGFAALTLDIGAVWLQTPPRARRH